MLVWYIYKRNSIKQNLSFDRVVKPFNQVCYCCLPQKGECVWQRVWCTQTYINLACYTRHEDKFNLQGQGFITFPPPLGPTSATFDPGCSLSVMPWNIQQYFHILISPSNQRGSTISTETNTNPRKIQKELMVKHVYLEHHVIRAGWIGEPDIIQIYFSIFVTIM